MGLWGLAVGGFLGERLWFLALGGLRRLGAGFQPLSTARAVSGVLYDSLVRRRGLRNVPDVGVAVVTSVSPGSVSVCLSVCVCLCLCLCAYAPTLACARGRLVGGEYHVELKHPKQW